MNLLKVIGLVLILLQMETGELFYQSVWIYRDSSVFSIGVKLTHDQVLETVPVGIVVSRVPPPPPFHIVYRAIINHFLLVIMSGGCCQRLAQPVYA